eukprot:6172629-Pleurochrysis_carterae.AAC.7
MKVQGETSTDGRVVDVVLRGSIVVAGDTAEYVIDSVEKNTYAGVVEKYGEYGGYLDCIPFLDSIALA